MAFFPSLVYFSYILCWDNLNPIWQWRGWPASIRTTLQIDQETW